MLRVYHIRPKVSNSMYCSVVKICFNQNIEIENQQLKCKGNEQWRKNENYAFRCRYFVMRV